MEFADQFFHPDDDPVPKNHKYLRLESAIQWDDLLGKMGAFFSKRRGRPSKSVKIYIMLLMVKHLENLSDEELLEKFQGSLPLQKACNIQFRAAQKYIKDASTFTKFRGRIGLEGCKIIEEAVEGFIVKKNSKRTKPS